MEFTEALNEPTSSEYRDLKQRVEEVLKRTYQPLQGFVSALVERFSSGSVIIDVIVQTTTVVSDELVSANQRLRSNIADIAPVIGPIGVMSLSMKAISFQSPLYTGTSQTLTCGPLPDSLAIGVLNRVSWQVDDRILQNNNRFLISNSNNTSWLTIRNLITNDRGVYQCTLVGQALNFTEKGELTEDTLLPAPILSVRERLNVRCEEDFVQPLLCCVQTPYIPQWLDPTLPSDTDLLSVEAGRRCERYNFRISCTESQSQAICHVDKTPFQKTTTLIIFREVIVCSSVLYGTGRVGDVSMPNCEPGLDGVRSAECQASGTWLLLENTCIVSEIKELLIESQGLVEETLGVFVADLSELVLSDLQPQITNSSATISAIVDILNTIGAVTTNITETIMQDILQTVDVIIGDDARDSWNDLNTNQTANTSSLLLGTMESITSNLDGEFSIFTGSILLNRTSFNNSFTADLNSSLVIDIPNTDFDNLFITTITFSTLINVLPPRLSSFNSTDANQAANDIDNQNRINAVVVLVSLNETKQSQITNVTLSYDKLNTSLTQDPQCVFWNFSLLDNLGAWDVDGCSFVTEVNNTVVCNCNHLTSFSLLMSTGLPPGAAEALDIITYIGVAISMLSLVICLIIEVLIWKSMTRNTTSFLRHVSIVNTAVSLLIADIWFIIGASITSEVDETVTVPLDACSAATFFIHLFYLALFFWMLVSALLLFYRTVMVFSHMSKSTMLAIGFSLGYGAPLIIAVVTVAATAPGGGYIRDNNGCWLNLEDTYALLAFILPAGVIIFINFIIMIVVLVKMLRRGAESSNSEEKNTLMVIFRCVAILFPTFGLTWALGVGIMVAPQNVGLHVTFALFNSLQGFFILVFGTLMDSKIRATLSRQILGPRTSSNQTRSTSGGTSSSGGWAFLNRIRGRQNVYHVSSMANNSSSNTATESFVNI